MDEKPALSDINISYSQQELPPSAETVLKKIESAQLTRAKQEIAEQLQVIQNRVNQAPRLHKEILKDENEYLFDGEETKKRSQMPYAFFQSSLEKENELDGVLQWLKDIAEELQGIEDDFKCSDITEEWVEEMEVKIETFMSDIMSCFKRAQKLCALLFDKDIRKTKEKDVIGKDGVWRWWREPEVGPRTILKIWKLQPPSADCMVSEISFGTKTATELSFMLVDMAKSLSCRKTMDIAFKFVQTGLHNLNDAFQAQSRRVEQLHTLQEENAEKWQAALKYTKTELEVRQRIVARLERENCKLREENAACLLQLNQQQEASQQQTVLTAPSGKENIQAQYLLSRTPQVTKWTPLSQKLHNLIETPQITEKEAIPQIQLEPLESEVDYFPGERYDQVSSATAESSSDNQVFLIPTPERSDIFEVMEKKSSILFKDFQSIVVNIIDTSLLKRSHKWDMKRQLEDMGLNANTNDTVNLYTILLNIIHESFEKLDIKLPCQVPKTILQKSTADNKLDQSRSSDDTSKTSSVSEMFLKRMRNHEAPIHTGDKKLRKDENVQDPSSTVTDQFSNVKNKRKEQTSKLHLDPKSLPEMPGQMKTEQIGQTADKTCHSFQEDLKDPSTTSSDSTLDENVGVNEVPQLHQKSTKGPKFKRRATRSIKLESALQNPEKALPSENHLLSESEEHSNEDMEPGEEKIARTLLKGVRYQMNKETQRTNLLLLQNALRKGQISLQLYKQAIALLENIPSAKLKCLAFLLRKYMAFKALQRVRYQLNIKIRFAREHKDGQALKEYYIILTKLDKYEKEVLGRWRRRQEAQERKYHVNLTRIIYMFHQLREAYSLNLLNPNSCQSYSLGKHFLAFKPQGTQQSVISREHCSPFPSVKTPTYLLRPRNITTSHPGAREPVGSEAPTVWKCSQTLEDVQHTSITVPIIPRLLEMNINHSKISALRTVQGRTGG